MRSCACKVAALILLGALSKAEMPEDDFRIINRQDLLAADSDIFEDKSTKSFSQLLFDVARDQVVVGARDALYRLSLRGLRPLERAGWQAPLDKSQLCQDKGQTEADCHNYVKVLLAYGHKLFACGTNAFSPVCTWREIESIGKVLDSTSGVANCPYSPHSNVTALLAATGEYYAGTPTDFTSSYTAICRSRGASSRDIGTLRSAQYDQNWLNEPQFVGSFEDDRYVYFVFREVAIEFMNCGKVIYSRIARVCKNDSGGHLTMKDNWSTFLKARINCSVPGDYPFYYDEVQSVEFLQHEGLLVATFTTPSNSIAGSAVCIYNMSTINAAFDGPYKVQDTPASTWEPKTPSPRARDHFRCVPDLGPHQTVEYLRYHLMYDAVQPISGAPIHTADLQRFTHVTMDVTQTKPIGKQYVAFVATQKNDVLKLAVLPNFAGACVVEVWRLADEKGRFDVLKMQFVKDTMSLYLGTHQGVVRLGAHRCGRYTTRESCLGAVDPYCGWHGARERCLDAPTHLYEAHFEQTTDKCPRTDTSVDGGWSAWSAWQPCAQETASPRLQFADERPGLCQCRVRRCDNPRPATGGKPCQGTSVAVSNCTVHGGWSPWSAWSECSASCGIALKTRRRGCSAPEPAFGGRVCLGLDTQEMYCSNLPPCPDPALAPVDGGWAPWGAWGPCAAAGEGAPSCGAAAGWRERHRDCTDPAPKNGGAECDGVSVERQVCDLRPCELKKAAAWTPWVQIPGNSSDGSYTEKRFKFLCKAPSSEQVKISIAREEDRYCTSHGHCSSSPPEEGSEWGPWGPWGPCSASCGGGHQTRLRNCNRPPCVGSADMLRACNTHACTGEWSCWSEWGPCSGSCESGGAGHRIRSRSCLSPGGCADAAAASERRVCLANCADREVGWGPWGAWSECAGGERVRRRGCERGACVGAIMQVALCDADDDLDNELPVMPAYSQNVEMASFVRLAGSDAMSMASVIGCVVAAFCVGCLVTLAAVVFCSRRQGSRLPWRRGAKVPSSPHYITAKQNSYVTVPLKDVPRKAKRQPSFTGIGGGSGIVLSKPNNLSNANNQQLNTPKLYPKAIANEYDTMGTMRRHSNMPNNRNNLDLEEEKFY